MTGVLKLFLIYPNKSHPYLHFYPQILGSLREIIYLCIRVLKLKAISD
jgi:hypothetical protein